MGSSPAQQGKHDLRQLLELLSELSITVDEQHDLRQVDGRGVRDILQRRQRVHAVSLEQRLPLVQQATHLLQRAPHRLLLSPRSHPANVHQVTQAQQARAKQVQHVDADSRRRVGERERRGDGAQQRRLAAAWPACDLGVAAGREKVHLPGVLPLTGGVVNDADREPQRGAGPDPQPRTGGTGLPGDQVEGGRLRQRWQPDRLRGTLLQAQLVHDRAEDRRAGRLRAGACCAGMSSSASARVTR